MMEAIFEIMREAKSLELIVSSYELLCELEKVLSSSSIHA